MTGDWQALVPSQRGAPSLPDEQHKRHYEYSVGWRYLASYFQPARSRKKGDSSDSSYSAY